ncbi:MAG: FGGY-family carbohydrate kinase [Christensenellales bacterium]|jgi:xylulokinase
MAYIGLDVGTSGVKATVMTQSGDVLASASREYNLRFPRPGWVEMRPSDVWAAAKAVLAEASAKAGWRIEAIATASFGEAAVLLDENGEAVMDSIFFTDMRGSEELADLRARVNPDAIQMRTGMPINHMYTLPKLLWLQKRRPDAFARTRKLLLYGSYIAYMLTGEAAIDSSLASRTLLFNRETLDWDDEILRAFAIDRDWLPRFVPAGMPIGHIHPARAMELGIDPSALVVSGVHDQIAAALGAGALYAGDVADGIGSAECLVAPLPAAPNFRAMFAANICAEPHALPGAHVALAFSNAAGSALKWYLNTFEPELSRRCALEGRNAYAALNETLSNAPSPLLFLPHLAGTGTPHMDAGATGTLAGLTLSSTRADIYRAIYEGMNFEIRMNLECLQGAGFCMRELTACGGGASAEALAIKADILQIPIRTLKNNQSGTVGMAMLCALACGRFHSFREATDALVVRGALIEPRAAHRAEYADKYAQYLRMYGATCAIYDR